jgi:lipopolysaccharide/colanic/teichoic acid biosynthesis glycosyltransferase
MITREIGVQRAMAAPDTNAVASRILDLVIAATATAVFALPMLVIAIAIWLEGGRPILFSQPRLGRGGHPFLMYKFRKFGASCGTTGSPLTLAEDERMTAVGRILAATKLDELPQLWNVLKGDMAVIGPRPESLAFADCFRNGFEEVLDYKPGLLGPSQILFRNEAKFYPPDADPTRFYRDVLFPTKARLDLAYFPRRSLAGDLGWLIKGVMAVFGWVPAQAVPQAVPRQGRAGLPETRETTNPEGAAR